MIIPSIDLQDGQTVQLIGGKQKALDAGDPHPIAERFGRVGEIAVIDLDAAMGKGRQSALIEPLLVRRCMACPSTSISQTSCLPRLLRMNETLEAKMPGSPVINL